jgi:hypothetical protein
MQDMFAGRCYTDPIFSNVPVLGEEMLSGNVLS